MPLSITVVMETTFGATDVSVADQDTENHEGPARICEGREKKKEKKTLENRENKKTQCRSTTMDTVVEHIQTGEKGI